MRSSSEPRLGEEWVLRTTVSSPVCAGDLGTQCPAHQCFNIIGISWNLWHNLRVMEARSGEVLWNLEVWIPKPLSGIGALNRNECELKNVKFLANLAFVKHQAIFSMAGTGSQSRSWVCVEKRTLLPACQCCRLWWFFSFSFCFLYSFPIPSPAFTSWYLSWIYIALTAFSSPDLLSLMCLGQEAR